MKSVSYRQSLLLGCAALALCSAGPAMAFGSSEVQPSIEIHLDVLNELSQSASAKAPAAEQTPEAMPFGKPTPAVKTTAAATPGANHPAHKVASNAKTSPHKVAKATPKTPAHETVMADAAPPSPMKAPTPPPEDKKPADAETIPKPDVKITQTPAAPPAKPALVADVPKLADAEIKPSTPAPAKPNAVADISGGLADVLSDDAGKKPAAAPAPEAALPAPSAPLPPAAFDPPAGLTNPPSDLTAAAPAGAPDKMPPSHVPAAADTPPPLSPVPEAHTDTTAGKMIMASNDSPAPSSLAIAPAKPDLPSLPPIAEKAPPQEMAQSTLTPLPGLPASPPAAPALPEAPPALAALPGVAAPQGSTPPTAPAETAAESPPGTAPNVRLIFNESETDVPLGSTGKLDALAATLNSNPAARVTIMAYASGPETTGIYPKRVSLARGIAVRNYLTSTKGVDIERVNVKALGNKDAGGGPGDRVDLFVLK